MFVPMDFKSFASNLKCNGIIKGVQHLHGLIQYKDRTYKHVQIEKKPEPRPSRKLLSGELEEEATKKRDLHVPCKAIKSIQRYILDMVLSPAFNEISPNAHGFLPERSVVTNAEPHVGAKMKVHMDLKDFFPSIKYRRIFGLFHKVWGYEPSLSYALSSLCTYKDRAPQGAPTSPAISNFVCMSLDKRMTGLANKVGLKYTRYADDLTFSSKKIFNAGKLTKVVELICNDEKFEVNKEKTSIVRSNRRMSVTGVVINSKLSVKKEDRHNQRAALHQLSIGQKTEQTEDSIFGMLSWIQMVCPDQAKKLRSRI